MWFGYAKAWRTKLATLVSFSDHSLFFEVIDYVPCLFYPKVGGWFASEGWPWCPFSFSESYLYWFTMHLPLAIQICGEDLPVLEEDFPEGSGEGVELRDVFHFPKLLHNCSARVSSSSWFL